MASLRVRGERGSVADISAALELTPSDSHDIGEPRSHRDPRPWGHVHWGLRSDLPDTATLEEHLSHICDRLQLRAAALQALLDSGYELDWFCFVETGNGQGGVSLSAGLLQRLAALPVELDLDIYG
jgi:hypothetical protein